MSNKSVIKLTPKLKFLVVIVAEISRAEHIREYMANTVTKKQKEKRI